MSSFDPFYESSFQTNSQSQYTPLPHALAETATVSNASNRLKKHEMFILAALWMEYSPYCLAPTVYFGRGHERRMNKSGAVLVDKEGRIVALEYSKSTHAITKCIMTAGGKARECNLYCSRFPDSLSSKLMVQSGIRRCYFFPAPIYPQYDETTDSPHFDAEYIHGKLLENLKSVYKLSIHSTFSLNLLIPEWIRTGNSTPPSSPRLSDHHRLHSNAHINQLMPLPKYLQSLKLGSMTKYGTPRYFEVDKFYLSAIGSMKNYERILDGFDHTLAGFHKVVERYSCELTWEGATKEHRELDDLALAEAQHAMVLAHIASRRTDDPKIGVGAVIVNSGSYISLGWNGFPKKSQRHDYPRLGADEATENEELKYAYVLHAEQNALLHRRDIGSLENCRFYSTKYPCDECAPVIFDMNIKCIFTTPKSNPPMLISPTRPSTSQNSNSNTHNRESSNTSIQQLPTSQDQRKASLMFLPGLSHPDSTATFPPTSFSTSPSYPCIDTIMSNSQIKRNSSSFQVNAAYRGLTYNKLGSLLGSTNGSLWIFRINNPASGLSVNHNGISGSPPTVKTNERSQSIREETNGTNGKSE